MSNIPVIPSPSDPLGISTHVAYQRERLEQQYGSRAAQGFELENLTSPTQRSARISTHSRKSSRKSLSGTSDAENEHLIRDAESPYLSDDGDDEETQMGPRRAAGVTFDSTADSPNGHANGRTSGSMDGSLMEHRRKHGAVDSPTSVNRREHRMRRASFSLDEAVPSIGMEYHGRSKGFTELPDRDRKNFMLLVLLYFLQGVPMGLATGSVSFLLKSHVSYAQMGVFSLASYPYSLKLLWSPIVDACWSPRFGRRKSWILPIQTMSGIGMLWLSGRIETMMKHAGDNDGANVWGFTWWWFGLVFMCATQDIAVDGWALTLLSTENLAYASTAQTVGLTAGQFLSSTVFLAFNSKDFANKWFRTVPLDYGLVSLGGALATAGWLYLIVTIGLALFKREELTKNDEGVWDVYKVMMGILKLKNIQTLIIVHLIAKIGFQANDGVTNLKLIDKGFGTDNLALTVLIDFPFEISLGYYVGKWSSTYPPMHLWSYAFMGRLVAALFAQLTVSIFPAGGVNAGYLLIVIISHVFSTFMNTVMFVAVSAFHAKIADPVYGGTYMTLLAT